MIKSWTPEKPKQVKTKVGREKSICSFEIEYTLLLSPLYDCIGQPNNMEMSLILLLYGYVIS